MNEELDDVWEVSIVRGSVRFTYWIDKLTYINLRDAVRGGGWKTFNALAGNEVMIQMADILSIEHSTLKSRNTDEEFNRMLKKEKEQYKEWE